MAITIFPIKKRNLWDVKGYQVLEKTTKFIPIILKSKEYHLHWNNLIRYYRFHLKIYTGGNNTGQR